MSSFETRIQYLKYQVLKEVAKEAWEQNLVENVLDIPKKIIPGKTPTMRCCVYKEREIVRERIRLACGMDTDGKITAVKVLSHQETAGLGSQVAESKFTDQFIGKGSDLDGVDVISGASRSSGYFINAIHDAFDAYEMAKGAD